MTYDEGMSEPGEIGSQTNETPRFISSLDKSKEESIRNLSDRLNALGRRMEDYQLHKGESSENPSKEASLTKVRDFVILSVRLGLKPEQEGGSMIGISIGRHGIHIRDSQLSWGNGNVDFKYINPEKGQLSFYEQESTILNSPINMGLVVSTITDREIQNEPAVIRIANGLPGLLETTYCFSPQCDIIKFINLPIGVKLKERIPSIPDSNTYILPINNQDMLVIERAIEVLNKNFSELPTNN